MKHVCTQNAMLIVKLVIVDLVNLFTVYVPYSICYCHSELFTELQVWYVKRCDMVVKNATNGSRSEIMWNRCERSDQNTGGICSSWFDDCSVFWKLRRSWTFRQTSYSSEISAFRTMTEQDPTVPSTSSLVAHNSVRDGRSDCSNIGVVVVTPRCADQGFVGGPCDSNSIGVQLYEQRCVSIKRIIRFHNGCYRIYYN